MFFFCTGTRTTEIYTLSLHDALPIYVLELRQLDLQLAFAGPCVPREDVEDQLRAVDHTQLIRSEEHTSELQSRFDLVCRLLLEKKKKCMIAAGVVGSSPLASRIRLWP